jgi:peptidoglycan hydrolase-like protein with peptidoglycan-binding domain
LLWWLGGGAVAVTVAGLGASRIVRSPAQRIAETAPPERSVLTAPVELRVLQDTVVLRGFVGAGTTVSVTPAPPDGARAVVTAVGVEAGERFEAGQVLVEVSGRPVIALAGQVPAFRDLRPGMRGRDVMQLQSGLRALGHLDSMPDGVYGSATKQAVAALYADRGYDAPVSGDPGALVAAEDGVRQAERTLAVAEEELARLEANPPSPAPGEPDPVDAARRQVRFAQEDLAAARAARDEVAQTTGAMLPQSEVVFLPEFPGRVERSAARVGLDFASGLEDPLLTVSSGELVVRTLLNPGQRELLAEGMPVEILSELTGITADGEIAAVGELAADETGGRSHPMRVEPVDGLLDEGLAGEDVRLSVTAAATDGQVLVVPLSAVFAGADGQVAVLRVDPDGGQVRVAVVAGVSGDGYVAITPVQGGLTAGDLVVVGAGGVAG